MTDDVLEHLLGAVPKDCPSGDIIPWLRDDLIPFVCQNFQSGKVGGKDFVFYFTCAHVKRPESWHDMYSLPIGYWQVSLTLGMTLLKQLRLIPELPIRQLPVWAVNFVSLAYLSWLCVHVKRPEMDNPVFHHSYCTIDKSFTNSIIAYHVFK